MILKDFAPGIIKLVPDGSVLAKVLKGAATQTNAGKMSASVVISTEDEDRSADIVKVAGIELADHRKNPVALLNHDKDMPIGRFADRLGNYTVKVRGGRELVGEIFFNQSSQFAHDVFRAVEEKVFSGVSIGFKPGRIEQRSPRGRIFHSGRLIEGSILTLGDNPNAIVEAVHKGFNNRPLSPELLAVLRPLVPERNATVTGGYEAKAMNPRDTMQGGDNPDPMDPDAPVDMGADATAQGDQTGQQNDHKATVDDSVGNIMASWYQQLCDGSIDKDVFMEKMDHLADTRDIHASADSGDDVDLDEDIDPEDLDDDGIPDDEDPDADNDGMPDDEEDVAGSDDKPKKKKKGDCPPEMPYKGFGFYHEYTPAFEAWVTKAYRYCRTIVNHPNTKAKPWSADKLKRVAADLMDEAMDLAPVKKAISEGSLVTKDAVSPAALAALEAAADGPLMTAFMQVQANQDQIMAQLGEYDRRLAAVTG